MRVLIGPNNFGLEDVIPGLTERYPDVDFAYCDDRARLNDEIADAEVYFGWLGRDTFQAAEKLRWVQSPSTGVDAFLRIPELREGDVILTSARGTHGACLAESVFGMLLAFTRGVRDFILHQQAHRWSNRDLRSCLVELRGGTLGIVGFGTVGRAVAERAQAFGMRILAVDVTPEGRPPYVERLDDVEHLDEMLRESDYVVVTVPYTAKNHGLIGAHELGQMKSSAILVGISRGSVIDEGALVDALEQGTIAAAALDVFSQEPLPEDSPLWDIPNLLITPHAAGGSQYEADAIREIFTENFLRYMREDFPLRNQINKELGF